MADIIQESKKLALEIKAQEAKYVSGELDLNPTLERTDQLFKQAIGTIENISANKILQDSGLLELQTKIARQCARSYKFDNLVFDPRTFSVKVKKFFCPSAVSDDDDNTTSIKQNTLLEMWEKLGAYSERIMNTVPTFSFMYGTFDADPEEPIKKIRKLTIKDKAGALTKPETVTPDAVLSDQDIMLKDATRVYSIFLRLVQKSEKRALCFYEFVTDPASFTRTVENIFLVSLLVKEGHVCILPDEQGLPCLKNVPQCEHQSWNSAVMQSVLSISIEDWENIVKTFKFKNALIPPPRRNQIVTGMNKNLNN